MAVSTRSLYGLRALFDLAYFSTGQPVTLAEIAMREDIPPRYLEAILIALRRAGLIDSRRGPSGGYRLAADPEKVTIQDVIAAIDGPQALPGQSMGRPGLGGGAASQLTADMWRDFGGVVCGWLNAVTLADLVKRAETLGVPREEQEALRAAS
jgi:Rrf2 family iron-sulfur cluster assembly transcriptional regulator